MQENPFHSEITQIIDVLKEAQAKIEKINNPELIFHTMPIISLLTNNIRILNFKIGIVEGAGAIGSNESLSQPLTKIFGKDIEVKPKEDALQIEKKKPSQVEIN